MTDQLTACAPACDQAHTPDDPHNTNRLTVEAPDLAQRPVSSYLNYPGDQRTLIGRRPLGPNAYGEAVYPVTAVYDQAHRRTRVGVTNIAPIAAS